MKNEMQQLLKANELMNQIIKSIKNSADAANLIAKWSHRELGPNPIHTAAALEARSQVFEWSR